MSTASDGNAQQDINTKNSPTAKPRWEQLFDEITADPLQKTRAVADKWTTITSALVGVSTVFGLALGRDAFDKLNLVAQIAFAVVLVLALLVSVSAIYLAALASEGKPQRLVRQEDDFNDWYRNATRIAIQNLTRSRHLALIAVVLLTLALCITWFGTEQPASGTSILAVPKSGAMICGTLAKDKTGNLVLMSAGSPPRALNDIVSFSVVSSCP